MVPSHLLDGWVRCHCVVERQLVFVVDAAHVAPSGYLPEYEAEGVHVGPLERVEVVDVQRLVQHLKNRSINMFYTNWMGWVTHFGCHVSFGADSVVEWYVNSVGGNVMSHGQAQVADGARAVRLDKNVFGFQVPVSNCRLSCKIGKIKRK